MDGVTRPSQEPQILLLVVLNMNKRISLNEVETILFTKISLGKMTPFVLKKFR